MTFLFPSHFQRLLVGDPETRWDIIPGVGLPRGLLSVRWVVIRFWDVRLVSGLQSWLPNGLGDRSLEQPLEQRQMLPVRTKKTG